LKELKCDYYNAKLGLAEDRTKFILFVRALLTKEGWNDPANTNKLCYMLAVSFLLTALIFFMKISEISIEIVLPFYIFFVDEIPLFFVLFSLTSLYMFATRPEYGKGMMAVIFSVGIVHFMFVHLYADSYSLEEVRAKTYENLPAEKKKPRLWTYDANWNKA
jgi:hypothetical protein